MKTMHNNENGTAGAEAGKGGTGLRALALAFVLGGLGPAAVAVEPAAGGAKVYQGRRSYALDELPEKLGAGPLAALEHWGGWAAERGYRLELSADGRVLLVLRARKAPKKELKLIEEALEQFDELLPAPERGPAGEPLWRGTGSVEAFFGLPKSAWIQHGPQADTETIVLLGIGEQDDYEAAIDLIVEGQPALASWARAGKGGPGFVLAEPLCASWLLGKLAAEEYDPHNELVNRLTRLLVMRRFGRQPWWLTVGLAWYMEIELRGTVYCFPGRSGFVASSSHGAWPSQLRKLARDRDAEISVERLAGLTAQGWDEERALLAWGTVKYLASAHGERLPHILENFRLLRNLQGIERWSDGAWRVDTGYRVPLEHQQALLVCHLGDGFEGDMAKVMAKGRWPRRRH
jgi:hypothetical protein